MAKTKNPKITVCNDGETFRTTVRTFLRANHELSADVKFAIRTLPPGGRVCFGGGAAPAWSVERPS